MHILVFTTLLSSFIFTASAIQCYNCESVSEANCGEDFDIEEHFKIDCDQVAPPRYLSNDLEYLNATACMKKIYKEYKVLKYVRSCYFGDVNDTEIGCRMDPSMMDFQDVQCFVCENDNYCNNAWSTKAVDGRLVQYLTVLIFILMAKIFN
ncbi:UPAR/Ly6 domain-containing protein bero [Calliphora vicina]|uniref:UPAR/Ly6 domain-containing protein bero n=1 Tax=Calliphora vicina TaxID=7373 RepID=UPI00325ABD29